MGEHSDTETVRTDHVAEDGVEDKKEPAEAEPEERVVKEEPVTRPRSGAGKWLGLAALLLALVALVISVVNVVRPDWTEKFDKTPPPASAPGPSQQEIDAAKGQACDAYNLVGGAVTLRSNVNLGPTPVPLDAEVVEINARQTFATGSTYLLSHLNAATPPPLAEAVRRFAADLQEVSMRALAGVNKDDPSQAGPLQNLVDLNGQIVELCK